MEVGKVAGEAVILDEPVIEPTPKAPPQADMAEFVEKYYVNVELLPYGEHWSRDIMLLGHNALRLELHDLQRVLLSMFQRGFNVGKSEVDLLYEWWDGFVDLVGEYFDYEEVVFFPWLTERAQLKSDRYGIHMRLHMKAKLLLVMRKIDDYQEKFMYTAAGERLPELAALLRYLTEALTEYIRYEDKKLNKTIAARYVESDLEAYYKRVERFILESDSPVQLYIFLTRHISGWRHWPSMIPRMRDNTVEMADAKSHFIMIDTLLAAGDPELPQPTFSYDINVVTTRLQGANLLGADGGLYDLNRSLKSTGSVQSAGNLSSKDNMSSRNPSAR